MMECGTERERGYICVLTASVYVCLSLTSSACSHTFVCLFICPTFVYVGQLV